MPALSDSECVHRDLFLLAMNLQVKSIFEKRLKHRSHHHSLALRCLCFGDNRVPVRIHPPGPSRDRHQEEGCRIGAAIAVHQVRRLYEPGDGLASQIKPSRRACVSAAASNERRRRIGPANFDRGHFEPWLDGGRSLNGRSLSLDRGRAHRFHRDGRSKSRSPGEEHGCFPRETRCHPIAVFHNHLDSLPAIRLRRRPAHEPRSARIFQTLDTEIW